MDFIDELKQFSKRVETIKDGIQTEEATKTSIIMPFFAMLGYDVFNPTEFCPEFTADVGIKKGEKVDYAILKDGAPIILIEAKWIGEKLQKHDSQLFRYFGTSKAKFAILTNGQIYNFYTDLEEPNKMDEKPFLTIDILDVKEPQVAELKKFCKSSFDIDAIFDIASELKYVNAFKNLFLEQLQNPSDDFTKLFLNDIYSGVKTQNVIDKFRPILKKSLNQCITETMNDKIKTVLDKNDGAEENEETAPEEQKREKNIVTTDEELEGYFIAKNILKDIAPMSDIFYRDTESYMSVLYKDNRNKWICRFVFTDTLKYILIPDKDKKTVRHDIQNVYDIKKYKDELTEALKRYM